MQLIKISLSDYIKLCVRIVYNAIGAAIAC